MFDNHHLIAIGGAALTDVRWNAPGAEALYLAADPTTAMLEAQTVIDQFKPITLVSHVLSSGHLLDTRDPANHAAYGLSYASMHNDLENVVLWACNTPGSAAIRINEPERRLPRNDRSWR